MYTFYEKLGIIANKVDRIVERLLIILTVLMFLTVLLQVFYRFLIVKIVYFPFHFTEELARYLLVWICYLGVAVGIPEGFHASFDLLIKKMSSLGGKIFFLIGRLLMIAFTLILIIKGWEVVLFVFNNSSPTMQIPMGWVYSAPFICGCLTMLRLLVDVMGEIYDFKSAKDRNRRGNALCK
jgi:TRAP-type C4-dicarboxylate transport system permease small subunit